MPSRVVTISAEVLLEGMAKHLQQILTPVKPSTEIKIKVARKRSISPLLLWGKFGQEVSVGKGSAGLRIQVPTSSEVMSAIQRRLNYLGNAEAEHFFRTLISPFLPPERLAEIHGSVSTKEIETFSQLLLVRTKSLYEATPFDKVFLFFEQLSLPEQETLVKEAKLLAAWQTIIIELCSDLQAADQLGTQLQILLTFLDIFYWEEQATPTKIVEEFLCSRVPGYRPWRKRNEIIPDNENDLELTDDVVPEDDFADCERFVFYTEELKCRKVVWPRGYFFEKGYVAFLLRATSGERFAILDAEKPGNAAYVFRIGWHKDDQQKWVPDAERSKQEVLSGVTTTFIRRFFHTKKWKEHVRRFLAK